MAEFSPYISVPVYIQMNFRQNQSRQGEAQRRSSSVDKTQLVTTVVNTKEAERGFSGYGTSTWRQIRQRQSAKVQQGQIQQKPKEMKEASQ